jgi:basic membrane lipoprotein Med (substrate-binding protein (PBP1-ABC) superfamily)
LAASSSICRSHSHHRQTDKAGTFKPGVIELGESSRVVMLVLNPTLAQRIPAAARTRIDSLQARMLAGQLTVSLDSLVNR